MLMPNRQPGTSAALKNFVRIRPRNRAVIVAERVGRTTVRVPLPTTMVAMGLNDIRWRFGAHFTWFALRFPVSRHRHHPTFWGQPKPFIGPFDDALLGGMIY